MKANKALKRLAKIETLMSDVAKRFSAHAPSLREAFADLKSAVDRVKEAVGVQATSAASKKKAASRKKASKKTASKAPMAKSAKKRAPVKKVAKRTAAKKTARVARKAAAASGAHESMPAPIEVE